MTRIAVFLLLGTSVFAQDPPYRMIDRALEKGEPAYFWFVFDQAQHDSGREWTIRKTESFRASQIEESMRFMERQTKDDVLRLYRGLTGLDRDARELFLSGEEIAAQMEEDFGWTPGPLLLSWLDLYGPGTVAVFLKLVSKDNLSPSFRDAKIMAYRPPFHSWSPRWVLGSVPSSIDLDQSGLVPFAPYLLQSLLPYPVSFLYWILPCILIGVALGLLEGYGLGWRARGGRVLVPARFGLDVFKGSINAAPRFLMIVLCILLFREFQKPIAFWMIALPLGLSCIPIVAARVAEHLKKAVDMDMIALRRGQGFSHFRVLMELGRYRLFVVPLQETFSQFIAFIYAETLIQFMVMMSEGTMQGIANQGSLGFVLARVSYGISMARHQALSVGFERFNLWYPMALVLAVFMLLTLGALTLRQHLERRAV